MLELKWRERKRRMRPDQCIHSLGGSSGYEAFVAWCSSSVVCNESVVCSESGRTAHDWLGTSLHMTGLTMTGH